MLPRSSGLCSKTFLMISTILAMGSLAGLSAAVAGEPQNETQFHADLPHAFQTAQHPKNHQTPLLLRFYQEFISPIDGDRCPMTPTCSQYAAQAFKKHGPVMGWIMTCDRLTRCGLHKEPALRLDPVADNDFWWFTAPNTADKSDQTDKAVSAFQEHTP